MSVTQPEPIIRRQQFFQPRIDSDTDTANPNCKGPFETLLDALHDSRRRQAARAIHQYRHLIPAPRSVRAGAAQTAANIFEQPKGKAKMTTSDDASSSFFQRSTKVQTTNGPKTNRLTWLLLAICVIGFGILHIAGGAIINGAVKPTAEMPPVQLHGD